MGDRIAILQKGGKLAQYATPAELLMLPGRQVRGGLRGRRPRAQAPGAPARARRGPLEGAAGAGGRAGGGGAPQGSRSPRCPICLLVDGDGRPRGWLSERGLSGERVVPELRSGPEPIVELDDVLRDALSDLLQNEAQYGPVVDERGAVAGRALARARRPRAEERPREGAERRRPGGRGRGLTQCSCCPGRDPRPLGDERELRGRQRLLPRLDRRQLRPLHRPARRPRLPHARLARDRLRDRLLAWRWSPTGGAGWSGPSRTSPGSSTRSRASRPSCCCSRSPAAARPPRSSRWWPTRC